MAERVRIRDQRLVIRQVVVSAESYRKLGNIAKVLKKRTGKSVTFAEVVEYLLDSHGA